MNSDTINNILVTIYMPTFNRLVLLKRAVSSVLRQSCSNIELIIVDDGSTDGTIEYLRSVQKMDDRVTMFKKDDFGGVKGACASRNIAIKNARGKYITGLDDDDYFLETHIELLVQKWISCAGKIVAIYPDIYQIKGGKLRKRGLKVSRCTYEMLIYGNWIGNQIFTETSHLRAVDGFDEFFPAWQDLECWYRLLKKHNGYAVSLGHRTCVLDAEHSFERISGKYDNVAQSFKMFVDKHKLTNFQSRALSTQLSFYGSERPSLAALACKCLGLPRIFNFRNALVIFYLSLTNN